MRVISRVILSAVLLILTGLLLAAAAYMPDPFFSYYRGISQMLLDWIGTVTELLPFALWQWLAVLALLLGLYFLISRRKLVRWLSGLLLWCSTAVFVFVALWGVNYFAPSVPQRVQVQSLEPTAQQLRDAALYMAQQAQTLEDLPARDDNGVMAADFDSWAETAHKGYDALARKDAFFRTDAKVKKLFYPEGFRHLGISGVFVPFTAEVCVNETIHPASLPFTMCRELSHTLTVAREDEANFCAFLACIEHPDAAFQYSGWYCAFHYTYAALQKADPAAAQEVAASVSQLLWQDAPPSSDLNFDEDSDPVANILTSWYLQQ